MTDDHEAPFSPHDPEPYGQTALLLVESLIHGLIARSIISVPDAIEIVRTAEEVTMDVAADFQEAPATTAKSLRLLGAIAASLRTDLAPS